jgi:hypothetical protein
MIDPLFYWIFLGSCSVFVLLRGGPPERVAIAIAIAASALTVALGPIAGEDRYRTVQIGVFMVDLATLAAFGALALLADRYWPLWITGIHMIGVATHSAKLLDPAIVPKVYGATQALWSYPILALIVIGTIRHRRRLRRFGADSSWTRYSGPAGRNSRRAGPNV